VSTIDVTNRVVEKESSLQALRQSPERYGLTIAAIAVSGIAIGLGASTVLPVDAVQGASTLPAFIGMVSLVALIVAAVTTQQHSAAWYQTQCRQLQTLNADLENQVKACASQLQVNRAELEAINQFRDVLIYAIAHDLRTTVMGTLLILKAWQDQPEQDPSSEQIPIARTTLARMTCCGEVQLNKLNALLKAYAYETEAYETEEIRLDRQSLSLMPLLQSVLTELQPLFLQNQTAIEAQLAIDPVLWIDAQQIQYVFWHLLNNAVKHNPPGIKIVIQAAIEAGMLRCTVSDNGKGIEEPQRDRLFDLRLGDAHERQLIGISLGLYLCRQIIVAHGGAIGVESQPGAGSQFWLTLPIGVEHPPEA
jgi:signal transduction histidine kinase